MPPYLAPKNNSNRIEEHRTTTDARVCNFINFYSYQRFLCSRKIARRWSYSVYKCMCVCVAHIAINPLPSSSFAQWQSVSDDAENFWPIFIQSAPFSSKHTRISRRQMLAHISNILRPPISTHFQPHAHDLDISFCFDCITLLPDFSLKANVYVCNYL